MPKLSWYSNEVRGAREDTGLDGKVTFFHHEKALFSANQLSCVQYDGSGNFLAVGDRGGKITIYRTSEQVSDIYPNSRLIRD